MPYLTLEEHHSQSEEDTTVWASSFAEKLSPGDAIGLRGSLGAGKTIVCKGIASGIGYGGPTSSPSFALVNEYRGKWKIFHIDLYRLGDEADWNEIGMDHYFSKDSICLVEWPDKLGKVEDFFNYLIELEDRGPSDRHIVLLKRT